MNKKIICIVLAVFCTTSLVRADDDYINAIITAVPSLSIAPDARAGGMGDVGAATSPDVYSQYWNPAKYAFIDSRAGLSVNYTPWLRKIVSDINLAYISGYYNISETAGVVSASLRYFSLGSVSLFTADGSNLGDAKPNEWALDVAYSRKLSEVFSAAVAFRYIHSDLNNGVNFSGTTSGPEMYPGNAFAADIALLYNQPIEVAGGTSRLGVGLNLSNLGSKISYDENTTTNFIPANMRLGVSYDLPIDEYNRISFSGDANKLLVPSQKVKSSNDPLHSWTTMSAEDYSNISSVDGWFRSFSDAPEGFSEELKEIQWGLGAEYAYNEQFLVRAGYSHEAKSKGNRRYFTVGAGFRLSMFELDAAYVIATSQTNPLDQTLRFSLAFNLDGMKNLVR